MKAKLTFVSFFAVVTLLAIPAHSQDLLKRIKPWLYPDDSLDTLRAKRELRFDRKNFGNRKMPRLSNGSHALSETQSFSDSVQALWVRHYASGLIPLDDQATAVAVDGSGNVYVTGYSVDSGTSKDYATIKYNASGFEQWVARYSGPGSGDDQAIALEVDAAGNVYVTGCSVGSFTYGDYATIKYNASGVEQWVARYDGPGNSNDQAIALAVDAAGNVYVTGSSEFSGFYPDYVTIKYNGSGVKQWVARYNGPSNSDDQATALAVDAAGNVYVTGYSVDLGTSKDYATIKYNASGFEQWVARYNGPSNSDDQATTLAVDAAGNVYVTGYSPGTSTSNDYATIKYNASGVQQWAARYNGPGNFIDQATALAVDTTGNVYVTGYSFGSSINYDYATIKYNPSGVEQWVARYNGVGNYDDKATTLAVDDAAGNVYVTGNSVGSGIGSDYATIKYNASGVEQWVARYDGPGSDDDQATALAVDAVGNIYVTGSSEVSIISSDYATIKYNGSGVEQWVARYNGPGSGDDQATALAVDAAGNVYVTGYSVGSGIGFDYATIKYNGSGVEQWVARYNGPVNFDDQATALAVDTVGNVYVTGSSVDFRTYTDYATIKYNGSGVEQWVARYNGLGSGDDQATALAVDTVGNVYVTGYSVGSATFYDYATIKYNASGVEQWVACYNGPGSGHDQATALAVDAAGNVYVTGYSYSGADSDYATIKYNASGVEQWVARYNGPGNSTDAATDLAVDAAGNVYVTGYSVGSDIFYDSDYATIKYNASGVQQWVARYGYNKPGITIAVASALAVDAAGNVYVTGTSLSTSAFGYATIKYNAAGVEQWVARYDGSGNNSNDQATALAVDAAGNVYVTGSSSEFSSSYPDYATIKYNGSGVEQWVARYDGPPGHFDSDDQATALAVDAAGNVYVTGSTIYLSNHVYTTIKYPQTASLLKAKTNAATNVTAISVTLNGTMNPNNLSMTVKFEYGTTRSYGDTVAATPGMVTGADDVLVSANLFNLLPNTTYHYRVFATHSGGLIEGEDQIFKTLSCEASTNVSHTPLSSPQPVNSNIRLSANVISVCGVDSVVLKYRRAGDPYFFSAEKSASADSLAWTIPASAVTSRGVEYFIVVAFFSGADTRLPPSGVFSIPITIAQSLKKGDEQPHGSEQNAYRLISVPLNLEDKNAKAVFEDNLGTYNKKKWRLFALRPDNQGYFEFSDTLKMNPGKAFMLIVKEAGKFIDTGSGTSNRTDQSFAIPLQPRWNFFGNPFNFSIPIKNLSVKSREAFALRFHQETWRDPIIHKVTHIQPFEGYAIFNTLDNIDTLLINPDLSSSPSSLAKGFTSTIEEKIQWSIRILAQCQDAADADNLVAIVSGASNSWDELDQPEPPTIGEFVSVFFPHPEWERLSENYCTDFRLESSEGYVWPLAVATNIRDKVYLTFDGLESVPEEDEIWLIDEVVPVAQNLRQNKSYVVAASSPEHPKRLKLIVGKHDFVEEKIANTQVIPTTYEINQNFPNPFNPATTIRYGLPKAERVTLKIYNLLGEEVVALLNDELQAAGYHMAIWDGRNKLGEVVGSGVYILRFRAGGFTAIKKMALVK